VTALDHVPQKDLADYFAGDLDAEREAAVEEHLITCGACTEEGTRVAAIAVGVRSLLPPFTTEEGVAAMRRRGLRVEENPMTAGQTTEPVLGPHLDVLVHRLLGPEPGTSSATFSMRVLETGVVLLGTDEVPIDAASGAVLLVCSPHYASFPPNMVASVTTRDATGAETTFEYTILHRFLPV